MPVSTAKAVTKKCGFLSFKLLLQLDEETFFRCGQISEYGRKYSRMVYSYLSEPDVTFDLRPWVRQAFSSQGIGGLGSENNLFSVLKAATAKRLQLGMQISIWLAQLFSRFFPFYMVFFFIENGDLISVDISYRGIVSCHCGLEIAGLLGSGACFGFSSDEQLPSCLYLPRSSPLQGKCPTSGFL